ncbi:E3 ubiquitin-protein ligase RGLG3-like isoform X1 [Musa acuminata AAA Group]|uniref:E3 ubiquitin-protein ligase RGLG3 isoform X1 n=1 Tax=Musa acuminata AAA Group TaxID=214697 RepID=UPI0031D059D6
MGNTNSAEGSSPRKYPLPSTRNYAHPSSHRYPQQAHFTAGSSFNNKNQNKQQPAFIADNFSSLEEVISALRDAGLESSNLILGIDFTKSNDWTVQRGDHCYLTIVGRHSFNRRSLHAIGDTTNPYEQAISIIGRTLSPFDEDNLIPCFGFGDASTRDEFVFSFYPDHRPSHGFEEALSRYREIVPCLTLSGPTSFAPLILAAIDIVEQSNWQYHVLVIVADGQVTKGSTLPNGFSQQEQATIDAIVEASHYPLSIIMIGVGDGPWDAMHQFDDYVPQRSFDNFQFVNFTKIMSENMPMTKKEAAFALSALMEIPLQYRATQGLKRKRLLKKHRNNEGKASWEKPLPPPRAVVDHDNAKSSKSSHGHAKYTNPDEYSIPMERACPICLTNPKDLAFSCGHLTCRDCGTAIPTCPICRSPITTRLRLFS